MSIEEKQPEESFFQKYGCLFLLAFLVIFFGILLLIGGFMLFGVHFFS